jgi:uncharacterized protein (TIGR00255 family)
MGALRSMTGIGLGSAPLERGTVSVELRAVNHRHLDVRVRAAAELSEDAIHIEELVRSGCGRGRVEANARWEPTSSESERVDFARARSIYESLLALRDQLAPGQEVPVTAVLQIPSLFAASVPLNAEARRVAIRDATQRAVADLSAMREREGEALARDLQQRLHCLREHAHWIESRRPELVAGVRSRLQKRIEKLLEGTDLELDQARLVQEVAWFADKSEIAEELTRLASHFEQFELILARAGEAAGKKLDFLVQEMSREINTIGSKANDAAITHRVVEMKAELERVREQVQNVL